MSIQITAGVPMFFPLDSEQIGDSNIFLIIVSWVDKSL